MCATRVQKALPAAQKASYQLLSQAVLICFVDVRAHDWIAVNAFAATAQVAWVAHTTYLTLPEPSRPPLFAARWDNVKKVCCAGGKRLYGLRSGWRAPPIACPCSEALLVRARMFGHACTAAAPRMHGCLHSRVSHTQVTAFPSTAALCATQGGNVCCPSGAPCRIVPGQKNDVCCATGECTLAQARSSC